MKKKFRWTLVVHDDAGNILVPRTFINLNNHPEITFEETELNYLNSKTFVAGQYGGDISFTVLDGESIYKLLEPYSRGSAWPVKFPMCDYSLELIGNYGEILERYTLEKGFVQSFNYGTIDYTHCEPTSIDMKIKYMNVKYENYGEDGMFPWKEPEVWIVHNPIKDSGEQILDDFLRRTAKESSSL